jgi:very-short-patch-repair endonuclease
MAVILILLVLFIAWHFIPQPNPAEPQPKFRRDHRIRAGDPQWPQFLEEHCESPAEAQFLRAVIEAYGLQPQNGSLCGGGLQIDFQVEEGRYRVDFLADRWLVVEIDGATYHSSPQALARDRVRDAYFEGLGYSVLRIPAKTVFERPQEAVARLRSALSVGKRKIERPVQPNGFERLHATMAGIPRAIAKLDEIVSRASAKIEALSEAEGIASAEEHLIRAAIESAETKLDLEAKLECAKVRAHYEQAFAQFEALFEAEFKQSAGKSETSSTTWIVADFPPLPSHPDPATAQCIKASYDALQEKREALFAKARRKMGEEPRLKPLVQQELVGLGCAQLMERLFPPTDVPDGTPIGRRRNRVPLSLLLSEIQRRGGVPHE